MYNALFFKGIFLFNILVSGGQHEEHICGRPLGMRFDKAGRLYVIDAYLGLFLVDVKTGNHNNVDFIHFRNKI